MNRAKFIVSILVCILLSSCTRAYRQVSLTSAKIVSVTPQGLSAARVLLEAGVHNPAGSFVLDSLDACVSLEGREALLVKGESPLRIQGHCDSVYVAALRVSFAKGFNAFGLLKLVGSESIADKMSVSAKARLSKRGRRGKVIEMKDVPLSAFALGQ